MIRKAIFLLAVPLLLLHSEALESVTSGFSADEKQFQSAVQIWTIERNKPKYLCSGVVLAPDTVLTAKSCIPEADQKGKRNLFISTASKLDYKESLAHFFDHAAARVLNAIAHDDFDLMLVFLKDRLNVDSAYLLTPSEVSQIRLEPIFVTGFGYRGPKLVRSGLGLSEAWNNYWYPNLAITPGEKFLAESTIVRLDAHELVIGEADNDGAACLGDEGAPIFSHVKTSFSNAQRLIGMVIAADGLDSCGKPSLAIRLDSLREFINDTMTQECRNRKRTWCKVEGLLSPDYEEANQSDNTAIDPMEIEAPPPPPPPEPLIIKAEPKPTPKPNKRRLHVSAEGAGCSCR